MDVFYEADVVTVFRQTNSALSLKARNGLQRLLIARPSEHLQ